MTQQERQNIEFKEAQARVVALFTESAEDEDFFRVRELAFAQEANKATSIGSLFEIMTRAGWDLEEIVKVVIDI